MAREFLASSSEYLEKDSAPVTGPPFTMACWFRATSATAGQVFMGLADKSASNKYHRLVLGGYLSGDPIYADTRSASTSRADTTTGYSVNTWHHGCGVWASTTSRACYLDGGSKGTNTDGVAPDGIDRFSIGRSGDSSPDAYYDGRLCEAAIWNVALTDSEVAELATGISPLMVRPDALVGYWPLLNADSDIDWWGDCDLTAGGTPTYGDGPPITYPSGLILPYAVPSSGATTGTASQTAGATTQAASGTMTPGPVTGTTAQSTAATTQAASGIVHVIGTAAQTAAAATQAASGIVHVIGSAAQSTAATTQAASGTASAPGIVTGTAAQTTAAPTQAASGTHTVPTFTGTAAQSTAPTTQIGTGSMWTNLAALVTQTTPAATQTASGTASEPSGQIVPGLEYTLPVSRCHYTLPENRLHFTLRE